MERVARDRIHSDSRFLLRRSARIWPLYFAVTGLYLLGCLGAHKTLRPLLADVFFLSNYLHCEVRGGWSLSTEEQFYIIAPLSLCLLRFIPRRMLVALPLLWLAVLPLLRYQALAAHPEKLVGDVIYFPFHLHSDGLAAGLVLSWVSIYCAKWWRSSQGVILVPVGISLAGIGLRLISKNTLSYTSLALIFAGLVLLGLRSSAANKLASWRGFFVIARLSFGAYLNHLALIELAPDVFSRCLRAFSSNPAVFAMVFLAVSGASLTLAFLTFALIERPFLLLRDDWVQARSRSENSRSSSQQSSSSPEAALLNLATHIGQSESRDLPAPVTSDELMKSHP